MKKNIVEIDGEAFFTAGYTMEQLEALMNLYRSLRRSFRVWQVVMVISALLLLLAVAIR